jgi:hypothetical protein
MNGKADDTTTSLLLVWVVFARDDLESGVRIWCHLKKLTAGPLCGFVAIIQNVRTYFCEQAQFDVHKYHTVAILCLNNDMRYPISGAGSLVFKSRT